MITGIQQRRFLQLFYSHHVWSLMSFQRPAVAGASDCGCLLPRLCVQYCRSGGLPELVTALAKHYSPIYGREIDPMKEVTVSVGTSEVRQRGTGGACGG